MKVIRCTTLEKFNRYISERSSFDTEQSLIEAVTGAFKGNEYTRIGTVFHKIIEGDYSGIVKVSPEVRVELVGRKKEEVIINLPASRKFDIDGYFVFLDVNQCRVAVDYGESYPTAFHEIRLFQEIEGVMITGCADILNGNVIRDIKTKYSPPDDSDYIDSFQWRLYLELFGADIFHFDLFVFEGYQKDKHGYDVRGLPLTRYLPPITCYRYPKMEEDNHKLVRDFIEWAKFRGIYESLPEYDGLNSFN